MRRKRGLEVPHESGREIKSVRNQIREIKIRDGEMEDRVVVELFPPDERKGTFTKI